MALHPVQSKRDMALGGMGRVIYGMGAGRETVHWGEIVCVFIKGDATTCVYEA